LKDFQIAATLQKSANAYEVGGIASSFHRDLDGEAITPQAVESAIPAFMASRGADGIQGGPLRLHHDFWQRFLQKAIASLRLPESKQYSLIAAISLPLGRVTKIWVDGDGVTHWRGVLSKANPIAQIIWDMLREGMIHLGVSLGGKIFETRNNGRDALGKPCTLITNIRIDELSITDNPALRLTGGEGTGAYISALAKSIQTTMGNDSGRTESFLRKAIGGDAGKEINSGDAGNKTGIGGRGVGEPKTLSPKGRGSISMDSSTTKTGMGGTSAAPERPTATHPEPSTDIYGFTIAELTRDLQKTCAAATRASFSSEKTLKKFGDSAIGLANLTDNPPSELINLAMLLRQVAQFSQALPHMDDYQAAGTVEAMSRDLGKALEDFQQKMPSELMGQKFKSPGSAAIGTLDVVFPQQYVNY
jgi:hypothetical protein